MLPSTTTRRPPLHCLLVGDADTILMVLRHMYDEEGVSPSRMAAFGSDGASVMLGCNNGVAVQLARTFNIFLLVAHCIAHRNALAAAHACASIPLAAWLEAQLRDILHFHGHSGKRKSVLRNIQEQLGAPKLALLKLAKARWLSRGDASRRILDVLPSLVVEFREMANTSTTASVLLSVVRMHKFLALLCFFVDIMALLTMLSRCFQKKHVYFKRVRGLIDSTKAVLEANYGGRGTSAITGERWNLLMSAAPQTAPTRAGYQFAGMDVAYSHADHCDVLRAAHQFSNNVIELLDEYFPDAPLHDALGIFHLSGLPDDKEGWDLVAATYGNAEVAIICGHFSQSQLARGRDAGMLELSSSLLADKVGCLVEWALFKQEMWRHHASGLDHPSAVKLLLTDEALPFPRMRLMLSIAEVVLTSTVECERGFHAATQIKTTTCACMRM